MEEAAEEEQGLTSLSSRRSSSRRSKAGHSSSKARRSSKAANSARLRPSEASCYIDCLPDEIVISVIAPKLIAAWDLRLLMLKQVNRAWRSLLASFRGLFGPFRLQLHFNTLAFGIDVFSVLEAYDSGCKEWRKVECATIASRIAVQADGLKVYSIGEQGICVLNLTGSDERGRPKSILGNGNLAWKTLMPNTHMVEASRSVAIIQGRFVFGEAIERADSRILCFHVFDIEQRKWEKIMVSEPDRVSKYSCCRLKHPQRGCLLVLDHQDKELLVYDVIALQERRNNFSIHVKGGKKIDVERIREVGDGSRVFAQGKREDKNLLAFASLDVLLDEGKLKFDEFVEQVNVPEGAFRSLRNDHVGGCHAILTRNEMEYLWRGRYVDTLDTNKKLYKKLVWEEEVKSTEFGQYFSTLI